VLPKNKDGKAEDSGNDEFTQDFETGKADPFDIAGWEKAEKNAHQG